MPTLLRRIGNSKCRVVHARCVVQQPTRRCKSNATSQRQIRNSGNPILENSDGILGLEIYVFSGILGKSPETRRSQDCCLQTSQGLTRLSSNSCAWLYSDFQFPTFLAMGNPSNPWGNGNSIFIVTEFSNNYNRSQ